MKQSAAAIILGIGSLLAGQAVAAEASPWLVRLRALHLDPADKSDPVGGTGAANRLTLDNKTFPELDVSYFFSPNLAAELVLTYPQKHDVLLDGKSIGTMKHLPPTLLAQYHFMPGAQVQPYAGAGLNYTTLSKVHLLGGNAGLEHKSFGLALQAGADFRLDQRWALNVDVKKVRIRSDVNSAGAIISKVKVDPLLLSVGVGYRF
ncbi:outer membrane beta-barrel protein [Pseudoduganella sp. LjRoot289]|uniref:OmpW/AlkL family protein n=1 Tax=Pseudoduganella sp. LjRoot289 TaxID=3342314 RepID=UPI003ECEDEF0